MSSKAAKRRKKFREREEKRMEAKMRQEAFKKALHSANPLEEMAKVMGIRLE